MECTVPFNTLQACRIQAYIDEYERCDDECSMNTYFEKLSAVVWYQ